MSVSVLFSFTGILSVPVPSNRLLKNTHLSRHASGLRSFPIAIGTSFLRISRALHPNVFDQPGKKLLFQQPAIIFHLP
jgi:hypothetical protein